MAAQFVVQAQTYVSYLDWSNQPNHKTQNVELLTADSLDKLYELIALYKMNNEYNKNRYEHAEVEFDIIREIVETYTIDNLRIYNTDAWTEHAETNCYAKEEKEKALEEFNKQQENNKE